MSDLIAAIATGSAATAIGIVRVSGEGCFAACDRVFRPRNGKPFAQQPSHKMVFGNMLDAAGAVIDQGLAVRFGRAATATPGRILPNFTATAPPWCSIRCCPPCLPPEPDRQTPESSQGEPS